MNYLTWNNAIGRFFFNEEKAEKEVYLFITRQDLVKIGKENGLIGNDESIFLDFIEAIRKGFLEKPLDGNILEHAIYAYHRWKGNHINFENVKVEYPLYLGYLTIFVLPLTENLLPNLRIDAYYPRIRKFLKEHELPPMPVQNEHNNWNSLWFDLYDWSFEEKNTELGYFEVHPFEENERWVYVGKPLSQSVFPAYSIRQLPQFFEISNLVPGEELDNKALRHLLLTKGKKYLWLSDKVLNTIRDSNNELGQSIISIVRKNYQEWTGNTDQYDPEDETIKKGNTIAQLRLCIEGNKLKGYKVYFRLYTQLDFPEDLTFKYKDRDYRCHQFGKGWSKPMSLPFSEGLELKDNLNKWRAKFPDKNVRLLIEGKNFHLSGWVEMPYMIASRMLLLAKEEQSASIEDWGDCFSEGDFIKLPSVGIPDGYVLYEICNPPIDHPDIPALQFKPDKRVLITGGIKIGVRTWLKDLLPDVELENGRGNESVYLTYDRSNENISLERKNVDQPIWVLPQDIKVNEGFYIKVEGEAAKVEQLKNYIVNSQGKVEELNEDTLPARDKFGQIIKREGSSLFAIGSRVLSIDKNVEKSLRLRQIPYVSYFRPNNSSGEYTPLERLDSEEFGELLLTFLTVKGESNPKDYFEAFDSIYQEKFNSEEINAHPLELSRLKRWSLNYLDYMGFLDYEYSTKRIVVNPPQFLLIPTQSGRKVLLIGGRTPELIEKIKAETEKERLQLNLEPQDPSLSPFILPSTITITGFDEINGNNIETKFRKIAENCSIFFEPDRLPQFRIAEYSGNIDEYRNQLIPDELFDDSGWPARNFDADRIRFVPISNESIDKSCSLIEYRLTEYSFKHRFWENGVSYDINKNWGRYMILNHFEKKVIFNDRDKNIVAIPATLPLPRLISEAMTLFSGKTPKRKFIEIEGIKTWFNIYENISPVFSYNYFLMKVGQKQKETTINL